MTQMRTIESVPFAKELAAAEGDLDVRASLAEASEE